jgi:AraC-like DNA-binding protein
VTNFMSTATDVPPAPSAWELEVRRPRPSLRGIVGDLAGYHEITSVPVRRRELPETHIVTIFNLGAPLRMAQPDVPGEIVVPQGAGFIAGLHETYTITETSGQQEGLEVRLSPMGAYRLFGVPMSDLANRTYLLEEIAPAWHQNLVERLLDAPDWDSRFHLAEQALARTPHNLAPYPEIVWAWQQLRHTHGKLPISELAAELGWSHTRLISRFRQQIGATPKQCARLLRFQQVVRHPAFAPGADWCDLAQRCGFYDQSHLIRETRAFAGDTPEGLARRRLTESAGYAAGEGVAG